MNDLDRAQELGMSVEEFQSLVGHDPLDSHLEFVQGGAHAPKDGKEYDSDKDVKLKKKKGKQNAQEKISAEVQDGGLHTHDESNPLGLHSHYPGGPLGGAHTHTAQNPLGHHTHRYSREELLEFKFARPGIMIDIDGVHSHEKPQLDFSDNPVVRDNPEGYHLHDPDLSKPAEGDRADEVAARNARVDKN